MDEELRIGGETERVKQEKKKTRPISCNYHMGQTHPSGFALILECFFSVLRGRLHVVDRVLHVILYAIYHLALVSTAAQRFVFNRVPPKVTGRQENKKPYQPVSLSCTGIKRQYFLCNLF